MAVVRAILLWFMMLAIPFQGYAAVAMLLCAPGPAYSSTGAVHDHSRHDHGAAGGQHLHAKVGSDDGANRHDVLSAQGDPSDASPHKCGNCAACHSVGMMPTLGMAILHGPPQADFAEPLGAVATVSLNVPHKPPRG